MGRVLRSITFRYGCAAASIALAIWLRLLLDPALGTQVPYATVLLAVLLTAGCGGLGPALAAAVMGAVASQYLLIPPRGSFGLKGFEQDVGLGLYLVTALGIALIGGAMHAARRRAVDSVQSAEERFRLLVEGATDHVIVLLDPAGNITSWNSGAERIKGYKADELLGQPWSRFHTAADIAEGKPERALPHALATGRYEEEGWRVRKDGSTFWASVTITPLRDRSGRHIGFAEITRDGTERRQAEHAFLRSVFENTLDAIVSIDERGIVQSFNRAGESIFGYSAAEVVGQNIKMLMPEPYRKEHDGYIANYLRTGKSQVIGSSREVQGRRKDGSAFPLRLALAEFQLNGARYFTGTLCDFTDRKRGEELLRASERLLQTVFDTVPFALNVKDQSGRYLMVNKVWNQYFGWEPETVIHKRVEDLPPYNDELPEGIYREEIRKSVERDQQVLSGGGQVVAFDRTVTMKGGRLRHLQSVKAPLRDDQGNVSGLVTATVDLTERKRAEDALHASEAQLRRFVEEAPAAIAMFDAQMRYLVASHRWLSDYGLTGQTVTGRSHYEVFPEIPERWKEIHRRCLAGAVERAEEDLFERSDGTVQWLRWEIRPWHTPSHEVGGIFMFSDEITSRKKAEEGLQASQRLLQTVFDTIPHHLIVKDLDSRYLMVNKAWCQAFGRTPEEVLHRPTSEQSARPAAEIARILDEDRRVFSGESVVTPMQGTLTVKTGEKRYFKGIKGPLRDEAGETVGLVAISMDVTAEIEAQQQAETAHAHLIDAIESLPAAFYMFDPEERLLLWNGRCQELQPEIFARLRQGMPFEEMLRIAAEIGVPEAEGQVEKWVSARLEQFRKRPGTFQQQLKDGRFIQGIDRRTSDGGTVCLRFDVTELRKREAELRQSQKLEAIGSLAGGIAHDFNNLLTVIGSYSGFIQDAAEGQEGIREDARVIRETSDRAAALTRQLLAFSRRQVLLMRPLEINRTVGNIEKMLRRLIGEHIELRTSLQANLRLIEADETQIEQIILNLAVNARDAMPKGGKLLIETDHRALDANYSATHAEVTPGDYVMLAVTDTGEGMSPEVQKRIFEPFFTTKPLGEGTGMGLATVYGIVKQMKGFIYVYSEPGKGTSFKTFFPESSNETAVGVSPVETAAKPAATETVLLVEDEELVRRSAVRILKSAGYVVLQASDPQEALRICGRSTEQIDLLLSDVVMPGLSGRELWDQVRDVRPMRVLFMSGYTDDAVVRHGILQGSVPFLSKPFTKQTLLAKVREVLDAPLQNGKALS
jgi:PAS domain S-box-containing protein